jgi:hypothetical protein
MDYVRVCAIDAGTRNFAYCFVDNLHWREPLRWTKEDLWREQPNRRRTPTKEDVVAITVAWCRRNAAALAECDYVVLENQIRIPFIVMNTVIQALHYDKCVSVHPMTVGAYYGLPKTREAKKAAGIAVVVRNGVNFGVANGKIDDLADAWLMAVYQLIQTGALSEHFLK